MAAPRKHIFSDNPDLAKVQEYSKNYEYIQFLQMAEVQEKKLQGEDLGELYLARAQTKLFIADDTVLDDLRAAAKLLPNGSKVVTIGTTLDPDCPNMFVVFNTDTGAGVRYKASLRKGAPLLYRLCGGMSMDIALCYEAEVLYYQGNIEKAAALAVPVYERSVAAGSREYLAIMSGFVVVRCHAAMGERDKLEGVMTQMLRYTKVLGRPRYRELYERIKNWVNSATGWLGETPRYHVTPNGVKLPLLEDRIYAISNGMLEIGKIEQGFIDVAQYIMPDACAIKDVEADIFEAMLNFKIGEKELAAETFYSAYSVTHKNRIIMPFVEYGAQILPLLQYVTGLPDGSRFARRWCDKLHQMATRYEETLRILRGEQSAGKADAKLLTDPELRILRNLVDEYTVAEVAEDLGESLQATKEYIRALYQKIGARNRTEAVAKALGGKIVDASGGIRS